MRDLLIARFGKEFGLDAIENRDGKVNAKVSDRHPLFHADKLQGSGKVTRRAPTP